MLLVCASLSFTADFVLRRCPFLYLMASMQDLKLQLQAARKKEAALKAELQVAETEAAPVCLKRCTARLRGVALRLLARSGDIRPAVQFLEMKGRSCTEEEVRGWFADLPEESKAVLLAPRPEDVQAARQLAEADKFLKERQLAHWVWEQNKTKGIAPTSGAILHQAAGEFAKGGNLKNKHRWVRHFMKRWSGRRARFSRGERMSQQECRSKAALVSLFSKFRSCVVFGGICWAFCRLGAARADCFRMTG